MARVNGTSDDDFIHRDGDGRTPPQGANDVVGLTDGNDVVDGLAGDDTVFAGRGDDIAQYRVFESGADELHLARGRDEVRVRSEDDVNVRLTFTSAEVGNGTERDSGSLGNQDGGLAVRLQGESGGDDLTGPVARVDDEGVVFTAGRGVTFDVRDLVTGTQRGDLFASVELGTRRGDDLGAQFPSQDAYINAGAGNDTVTGGRGDDFLVGGAGDDALFGRNGSDSLLGGGGDDTLDGGGGNDTAIFNASADGADSIDLGDGNDNVDVSAAVALTQVRLTFTSAEVGNGSANDADDLANQDGGLAVRLQVESRGDALTGPVTRVDDEGITFRAADGVTFDVRDLVSGIERGDEFTRVTLGTQRGDELTAERNEATYINAGMGNDVVTGGREADVLVGGMGADTLAGGRSDDTYVADADDRIREGRNGGTDTVLAAGDVSLDGWRGVENLTLTGAADSDGTGNRGANTIVGNTGANVIDGGVGDDVLTGGAGADSFLFSSGPGRGVDALSDFATGEDQLMFEASAFRGLRENTLIDDVFTSGPVEADDRIIYDRRAGTLSFDRDGSGDRFDAVEIAELGRRTALVADDISIV